MDRRNFFKRTAGVAAAPFVLKWERPAEAKVDLSDQSVYDVEAFASKAAHMYRPKKEGIGLAPKPLASNVFVEINGHDISDCVRNVTLTSDTDIHTRLNEYTGEFLRFPGTRRAECEIVMTLSKLRAVEIRFEDLQPCTIRLGIPGSKEPLYIFEGIVERLDYESDMNIDCARIVVVGPVTVDMDKKRRKRCSGLSSSRKRNA